MVPLLSAKAPDMRLFVISGVLLLLKTLKRTPSKRTRPSFVVNQMYPSGVRAMPVTEFCGSPLSVVHLSMRSCALRWGTGVAKTIVVTKNRGSNQSNLFWNPIDLTETIALFEGVVVVK